MMNERSLTNTRTTKFEALHVSAFLIVVFSGFYLNNTTYAPVYMTTAVALVLLLLSVKRIKVARRQFDIIVIALLYSLFVVIFEREEESNNTQFNFLFSMLYLIVSILICSSITKEYLLELSMKFINFSIVLLIIEAVWRYTHPSDNLLYNALSNVSFYKYKFGSIMYQDSNFVGIFAICVLFFAVYLDVRQNEKTRVQQFILLALCMLSLSRATMISSVVFFYFFSGAIKRNTKKHLFLLLLVIGIYVASNFVLYDGSFISKLDIVGRTVEFFGRASIGEKLFGIGLGMSKQYIGIGSHNFVVTYLLETGIIGFIFLLLIWMVVFFVSKKKVYYVMFPFLIAGLSAAQHFIPFLYCIYATIISLEDNRNI